ncbi:hypothetical protein B0H14DRAFT_2535236 [Mycena olivaceomarginata]|nr:hypothetical protein B0H14DRAFT_2535236 [Mycena olivaceomarginata]
MTHVQLPWPPHDIFHNLVEKSSGYFIYASTIIKFIDDKNHRPTQRLALILHSNGTGSESPYDALDQLYMTILSSARRQSEFMPILSIMAAYTQRISMIEELLGLQMGDMELLLRGLHSVIKISHMGTIASYHASFLDFLNNVGRSQKFYVGSLENRMYLARCFLHFAAGRYRYEKRRFRESKPRDSPRIVYQELLPLIISLPPSVELCPLIEHMNHNHIFNLKSNLGSMLSWLNKILSAPRDLIQVWQDYALLSSFHASEGSAEVESTQKYLETARTSFCRVTTLLSFKPSSEWCFLDIPLWRVSSCTGITWDELKASMCSIRPIISRYDDEPPLNVLLRLLPREAYSRACRDLALRCIPRMLKNPLLGEMPLVEYNVWRQFPLLVRMSPHCPELYRALWSIPFPE